LHFSGSFDWAIDLIEPSWCPHRLKPKKLNFTCIIK
jgi:hypothetical protein